MQDKYLDLPQEYLNLNRAFQNPNIPEFNKQLRVSFFLYHIQEEHPDDWAKQKIPINGKVVWINRSGMVKGYGVSFGESNAMKALKETIENQITDLMLKKEHNYTF